MILGDIMKYCVPLLKIGNSWNSVLPKFIQLQDPPFTTVE